MFDPATGKIRDLGGLTEACGEQGRKAIVQGKSHVNFVESKGKLYFATHVGYYSIENGMETMGVPPAGYQALSGRASACLRHGDRQVRRSGHRARREGVLVDEHGHGAGADLRSDVADRAVLSLRSGRERPQGLRPGARAGRERQRAATTARSAARSPSIPAMARPISPTRKGRSIATAPRPMPSRSCRAMT